MGVVGCDWSCVVMRCKKQIQENGCAPKRHNLGRQVSVGWHATQDAEPRAVHNACLPTVVGVPDIVLVPGLGNPSHCAWWHRELDVQGFRLVLEWS